MDLTDSRLPQSGCEKLELALISFFEQFRKIYIGDQVQKTSRVSFASIQLFLFND
jgi:exportin-7